MSTSILDTLGKKNMYDIACLCFLSSCVCVLRELLRSSHGKKLTRNKLEQASWIGSLYMKKSELPTENISSYERCFVCHNSERFFSKIS